MNPLESVQQWVERPLRGEKSGRFLARLGVEPRRFWLLIDLFANLSESGEATTEMGRNEAVLKTGFFLFAAFSAILSIVLLNAGAAPRTYLLAFLGMTAYVLLPPLLSETGNTLVNPTEGMVLAHQPINGATYTAAKLTHLLKVVLYLALGTNAIPSVVGAFVTGSNLAYIPLHLAATLLWGFALALACCGLFGWLLRFVPAKRLKTAVQFATSLPFLFFVQGDRLFRAMHVTNWLPANPGIRWTLATIAFVAFGFATWYGLRSLSADYLVRASAIGRGGPVTASRRQSGWMSGLVARFFGGQQARGGFAFVSRMMLRDWQFRCQLIPLFFMPVVLIGSIARGGWRVDPFSGEFAIMQITPHLLGSLLFFICFALRYGNDYKGAWMFQLMPSGAVGGFVRGVYAALWIPIIALPHAILLPVFAWNWGASHGALFVAFSLAVSSLWLGIELRAINGIPFSQQVQPTGGMYVLPLMFLGGLVMAFAVAVQHFLIFRSAMVVVLMTVLLAVADYFVTRASLKDLAVSVRHHLAMTSGETGTIYKEVGA